MSRTILAACTALLAARSATASAIAGPLAAPGEGVGVSCASNEPPSREQSNTVE